MLTLKLIGVSLLAVVMACLFAVMIIVGTPVRAYRGAARQRHKL